jgi:hypothetical protein
MTNNDLPDSMSDGQPDEMQQESEQDHQEVADEEPQVFALKQSGGVWRMTRKEILQAAITAATAGAAAFSTDESDGQVKAKSNHHRHIKHGRKTTHHNTHHTHHHTTHQTVIGHYWRPN